MPRTKTTGIVKSVEQKAREAEAARLSRQRKNLEKEQKDKLLEDLSNKNEKLKTKNLSFRRIKRIMYENNPKRGNSTAAKWSKYCL